MTCGWCTYCSHGLCGHRTSANTAQFKTPLVVAYYDVDYVKNAKGTNYWRNRFVIVGDLPSDGERRTRTFFSVAHNSYASFQNHEGGQEIYRPEGLLCRVKQG